MSSRQRDGSTPSRLDAKPQRGVVAMQSAVPLEALNARSLSVSQTTGNVVRTIVETFVRRKRDGSTPSRLDAKPQRGVVAVQSAVPLEA